MAVNNQKDNNVSDGQTATKRSTVKKEKTKEKACEKAETKDPLFEA